MSRTKRSPLRQAMYSAWATIEACGSISSEQMEMLRNGPDDAQIIAEYVTLLDRKQQSPNPATRDLARRVACNVWKLARLE